MNEDQNPEEALNPKDINSQEDSQEEPLDAHVMEEDEDDGQVSFEQRKYCMGIQVARRTKVFVCSSRQ